MARARRAGRPSRANWHPARRRAVPGAARARRRSPRALPHRRRRPSPSPRRPLAGRSRARRDPATKASTTAARASLALAPPDAARQLGRPAPALERRSLQPFVGREAFEQVAESVLAAVLRLPAELG